MEKIFLIGFMGVGKSTTAKQLATELSWRFIDTDLEIEKSCGLSISEIFANYGEIFFRMEERSILKKILKEDRVVVATGGGMPIFFDNLELMKKNGFVVYLSVSLDVIKERLNRKSESSKRPLSQSANLDEIFRLREHYYNRAHYICVADKLTPLEIVEKIKGAYKKWKKSL